MVSGLMDGICRLRGDGDVDPVAPVRIAISAERRQKIKTAISSWYFSAHDFSDDELLHAAMLMLQHALALPELEQWRIPTGKLDPFLQLVFRSLP
jgi:3',5'-cyclic-nucleotide phosphodiesterase